MNLYIYSDESGVFDVIHNKYYVYGGLIFSSKEDKDNASRRYIAIEDKMRKFYTITHDIEIKASNSINKVRRKLYQALSHYQKFGAYIVEDEVLSDIYKEKKSKQRYLDYVYVLTIKRALQYMITSGAIDPSQVTNMHFYVDEHTTATNGHYELKESLLQEFKYGKYNYNFSTFFPPIFPNLQTLTLEYKNSKTNTLVRAADMVANKIFYLVNNNKFDELSNDGLHVTKFPENVRTKRSKLTV